MGLSFAKSVRFGAVRFNFSGSGIGISYGIPGLRIGTGPRGAYISASAGGFRYRQSLSSTAKPMSRAPRAGARQGASAPASQTNNIASTMVHDSSSVLQLTDANSDALLSSINEQRRRTPLWPFALAAAALVMWAAVEETDWSPVVLGGVMALLTVFVGWVAWRDRIRKLTVLFFDPDAATVKVFNELVQGLKVAGLSRKLKSIATTSQYSDSRYSAGATKGLQLSNASMSVGHAPGILANVEVPLICTGRTTLALYPDRVLALNGKDVGAILYSELTAVSRVAQYIETEDVPNDANVVGKTWKFVNKNGTSDRRFKNNSELPVCQYCQLDLSTATGLDMRFLCSRDGGFGPLAVALATASRLRIGVGAPVHPLQSANPQPQPSCPPKPSVDSDVWLGIALAIATQGHDRDAIVSALLSRGCPRSNAEQAADQAIEMQPGGDKWHHASPNVNAAAPQTSILASVVLPIVGLLVAGFFLLVMSNPNTFRTREEVPAAAASATVGYQPTIPVPAKTWSSQLPADVSRFDEVKGEGEIRYASLPPSDEFQGFRDELAKPFVLKLLQMVPMPGGRQLLVFSSHPPDFGCHACHPLLSAMLVAASNGEPYITLLPLQVLGTAGKFGSISLQGDRRVSLLKVGPNREGFVFKDSDGGQGSIVEWGNFFGIEKDAFRPLGYFHVHEDSFGSESCLDQKKELCAQKDTKIRFARGSAFADYFDILASEVSIDPYKGDGLPASRTYVMRFNGERYAEVPSVPASSANAEPAPASGSFKP